MDQQKFNDFDPKLSRFRCTSCGNLTRFDIKVTRQTSAFYHFGIDGQLCVEEEEVLSQRFNAVECRWCGPSGEIEVIDNNAEEPQDDQAAT